MLISLALGSAVAAPDVDLVPDEFATLQEALDHGAAPVIRLAPGRHAGATVTRPVEITGDGAVLDRGVRAGSARAGLVLPEAASGTRITGLTFDCQTSALDLGVLSSAARGGTVADHVEIDHSRFLGCAQAITDSGPPASRCDAEAVAGGAFWAIHDNVIDGLVTRLDRGGSGGGIGVFVYNAEGADLWGNTVTGEVRDDPTFATTGVALAGCVDCTVAGNTFAVRGGRFWYTAVHNAGARVKGAAASRNLLLADNDASDDGAPWLGVSYASFDSVATEVGENLGVLYVDHDQCGDGEIYATEAE